MTAPTITVDSISSTNAYVQITFSEEVTNAVGNDLSRYDFAVSISGGNSSYLTLDSIPSSIFSYAPSFPKTYRLFLDFTSGDGNFHPNGNETLTIAPASSTSIKNSSNEYWTASATTSLAAQTTIKTVITNEEDQHLWFYLYTGFQSTAANRGTNNSYWQYLGSASAGSHVTSSALVAAKFNNSGPHGFYGESIISSTQALELDQYVTTMSTLISKSGSAVQTYADDSSKLLISDGIWDSSQTDHSSRHPIMHSDSRYLKITRPSGSAETNWGGSINSAAQWGTWSAFAINDSTEHDMDPPTLVSATSSAKNLLELVFSEPIVQSDGSAHTVATIPMNSSGLRLSSTNIGVNEFTLDSLSYSGTSVPDDTITFQFKYDGEVTGSDNLTFDLNQYIARDDGGVYPQNNITGTIGFGSGGTTRTANSIALNIANSGSSTKHFYMKVDYGHPDSFKDYDGNPGNSWLSLGSAAQDVTLTANVSDFYLNGRSYNSSNYIGSYSIYAYSSAQDASSFSSEAPNQYSTPSVTIYDVSSSSEPRWGAGRVRYDIPFDGSSFGTVVPYDSGGNALDIAASLPNMTSTNSGGNLYIIADFGERMRIPGFEESYGSLSFTSSINSTDDLSNVLTGSLFRISRDSNYTGSIGSTITISEANYVTSPTTGVANGAWAITASYTGNADGTERLEFGWDYSIYGISVYDDSLNSKDMDSIFQADLYYSAAERASWPTTDQYESYGRLGPLSQDSLAEVVTETVAAASGGTVSAGGTNEAPRAEVTIPADALSSDTEIGVDTSADEDAATLGLAEYGETPFSPLVSLTPHGTTFSSGVTVKFNLIGSAAGTCPAGLTLMKRNGTGGSWYPVPSNLYSCSDGTITLVTSTFSEYIILGGQKVARTKLNNVQLARLERANKVLPEAINITGSGQTHIQTITNDDMFIVQSGSGVTSIISASKMAEYFSSAVAATTIDVSETSGAGAHRIVFIDAGSGDKDGATLEVDNDGLTFNPSTNALAVGGAVSADSLTISGDIDIDGTTNLDAVDIDGAVQADGTITVGASEDGYDVKFFGNGAGKSLLWDEDEDSLIITGDAVDALKVVGGVDIDGAVQIDAGDLNVGVDGTGRDVKFFGDTASAYMQWDASTDDLILGGVAGLIVPEGQLTLGSTPVAATAAELNKLDGASDDVTAAKLSTLSALSDAEIAFLDGAQVGTVQASKAVVYSAAGLVQATDLAVPDGGALSNASVADMIKLNAAEVVFSDGAIDVDIKSHDGTNGLKLGSVLVTAEAADLNKLDGASSDSQASKALVFDTNGNFEMQDDDKIFFGNDEDSSISWDGSALLVDSAAITLGADGSTVTLPGDLVVQGTTTQVDTQNLQVKDKNILLNDGGTTALSTGAGIDIEGDSAQVVGYMRVASANNAELEFKAPGSAGVLTIDMDASAELEFTAAKKLSVGGNFTIDADITSTAAELNKLDGADANVTAAKLNTLSALSDAEIGFVDGAQAGSAVASKAVVLSSDLDFEGFRDLSGSRHISASAFYGDGSQLTGVGAAVEEDGNSTEFKLTFVPDTTSDAATLKIDADDNQATYNPGLNRLGVSTVKGSTTLTLEGGAGAVIITGSEGITLSSVADNHALVVADDALYFKDSDGKIKSDSFADIMTLATAGATGLSATAGVLAIDVDELTELAAAPHATEDEFIVSDNGTEKRVSMTNLAKGVFALVTGGDATINSAGEVIIGNGEVETAMLADDAVTTAKIADSNVTTAKIADDNVTTAKIADSNVTTAKIADSNVTTAKIADLNVTAGKLASDSVITAKILDSNVTTAKIADLNVTAGKLAADSVETVKIKDSNVTTAKIADANVTTAKIADDNVTTAKIADSNVTTAKIADSNVTTDKIADDNVTTAKIADAAVTAAKIADNAVGADALADSVVNNGGIQIDNGVLSIDAVEKIFYSASSNTGADGGMSLDLLTASLANTPDGDPLDGTLQVFLNGMLQTVSSSTGHTSHLSVFDYRLDDATTPTEIRMIQPLDEDDILVVRYIAK